MMEKIKEKAVQAWVAGLGKPQVVIYDDFVGRVEFRFTDVENFTMQYKYKTLDCLCFYENGREVKVRYSYNGELVEEFCK